MKITKTQLKQIIKEELDTALNEKFQDPGGEADPDSHWGQARQKKEKERQWRAGAEDRAKEKKKQDQRRTDRELENKLGDYIWMLKKFTENATTLKGRFGSSNIMDDIVRLIRGDMPYSYKANISNIDRKKVTELGYLINALAEPYNSLYGALQDRDYEIHKSQPEGPEKSRWEKEREEEETAWFLASHGILQENTK